MAGSYVLPQVRVFQEFAETPNDVTQNLNPCAIGPNYQLIRYANEDERGDCSHETYDPANGKDITWATGLSGTEVDKKDGYSATFVNAYAKFGDLDAPTCRDAANNVGTKFEFTLGDGKTLTGEGGTLKFGTAVKAGDYLGYKAQATDTWSFVKIRSITPGLIEPAQITYGVKKGGSENTDLNVDLSSYAGEQSGVVKITINADGQVSLSSSAITGFSGITAASAATAVPASTAASGLDVGLGIKIKKAAADTQLAAGVYTLTLTLSEPYARDTVTVAKAIPSTLNTATVFRRFDAIAVKDTDLSLKEDGAGVTVSAGATVDASDHTFTVISAEAYLNQRNIRKDHTDGVYAVSTDADIIRELGSIEKENPLAYALHVMLLNCASATIHYIGVTSDDLAGYTKALERASITAEVYAMCPLTEKKEIIDAVVADCNRLSSAEEKSWRIAFFSQPTDKVKDATPYDLDEDKNPVYEKCTVVTSGTGTSAVTTLTCRPAGGTISQESQVADFVDTVQPNDTVVITVSGVDYTRTVGKVTGATTLTLNEALPSAAASTAAANLCSFKITHTLKHSEYVNAIAATSSNYRDHRAYNVFPNTLRDSSGTYVSGMYGAAAVCALACSVAPQQPITNVEIKGFIDLPEVYATYSRDELNTIASGGTLILMQEKSGGTVYVRHQISTAYPDGNLNTTELSMTKNLDSISYYFANRFAPYIGRYNISDDLMAELKAILLDGLSYLETTTETNRLIGPQVLPEGTEILKLYRSTEKDKVYANVALNLPAPFNNFDLHLSVI